MLVGRTCPCYQRHRDSQDWTWQGNDEGEEFYEVLKPEAPDEGICEVALLLSVSASVGRDTVKAILGQDAIMYEIRSRAAPSPYFLRSRKQLDVFGCEARQLLTDMRDAQTQNRTVDLFAAVPAPIAIEFGRCLKPYGPPIRVYEYRKVDRTYVPALTVNPMVSQHC